MSTISSERAESDNSKNEKNFERKGFFQKKFININFVFFLLCMGIIVQSMVVNGAYSVSLTTIQTYYKFTTVQLSLIDNFYNFSFGICAILLFISPISNKMLWVGIGVFSISMGCLIFILPAIFEQNNPANVVEPPVLCAASNPLEEIKTRVVRSKLYLAIMCIAYSIIGFGSAPLHTLTISFIAEHTSFRQGGLYNGIYYSFGAVGSIIAFIVHFFTVQIPINIAHNTNSLTPDSENWVGAYWVVYLIGFCLALLISLSILSFPPLPKKKDLNEKIVPAYSHLSFVMTWEVIKKAFKNIPFIFLTISMFFDGLVINGLTVFFPKLIETQFSVSSSRAALFSGSIFVFGSMIGLMCGGFTIKYFGWSYKKLIDRICFFSLIGSGFFLFLFFRCPTNQINGVTQGPNKSLKYTTSCAATCNCDIKDYAPVCLDHKKTYYSPCSIGCTQQSGVKGSIKFSLCSCGVEIPENTQVNKGACSSECRFIIPFLIFGFIAIILHYIIYTPEITFTIEISGQDSSISYLSFQQTILRLSYIIGSLLIGGLTDLSCSIWSSSQSGNSSSNCINYNLEKLSYSIAIPSVVCKLTATGFLFLASLFTKDPTTNF
ncbi:hypothetical protein HZS_6198 [Henneguya salminicola]|nr:hypothetical protein HZS_6198 [Henneguya salminicola]